MSDTNEKITVLVVEPGKEPYAEDYIQKRDGSPTAMEIKGNCPLQALWRTISFCLMASTIQRNI